ncbi:hypothetical protein [Streptomyces sp. SGAir0957]
MPFPTQRTPLTPYPEPAGALPACQDSAALPRMFPAPVAELMAAFCHTRGLPTLATNEACADEYRMVARSVIQHILEGWQELTQGHGTMGDLVINAALPPVAYPTSRPSADPA